MNFPVKQVTKRYVVVASLLVLACLFVIGKAIYIMTIKKDYWMAINDRFIKENEVVQPTRGNILADDGELLAASLPEYKIFMDFMSWEKDPKRQAKEQAKRDSLLMCKMDSICQGVHAVLPQIDPKAFRELLLKGRKEKATIGNSTISAFPTFNTDNSNNCQSSVFRPTWVDSTQRSLRHVRTLTAIWLTAQLATSII